MANAIGFIETKGLVGALAAVDAMLKAADVTYAGKEVTGPAMILIKIKGDPASVKYALEAGEMAAKNAGNFISSLIIDEPDERLAAVLPEIKIEDDIPAPQENAVEVEPGIVSEKVIVKEVEHDNFIKNNDLEEPASDTSAEFIANDLPVPEIIPVQETISTPDINTKSVEKKKRSARKKVKKIDSEETDKNKKEQPAIEEVVEEINVKEESISSENTSDYAISDEDAIEIKDNVEKKFEGEVVEETIEPVRVKEDINVSEELADVSEEVPEQNKKRNTKKAKQKAEPENLFAGTLFEDLFDAPEENITNEEVETEINNSTLDRLKKEASENIENVEPETKAAVDNDLPNNDEETELSQPVEEIAPVNGTDAPESPDNNIENMEAAPAVVVASKPDMETKAIKTKVQDESKKTKKKSDSIKKQKDESTNNTSGEIHLPANLTMDYLTTINVHLLRKAARGVTGFPIQGREISKANRQVLLDYFAGLA